jgi:hypothetical protein
MCFAHHNLCLGELTGESKAASCAGRAARTGRGHRWQSNGRPVEINRTERVLNEILDDAEADRLPACGPQVDPRSSEAARTGWLVKEARNRPLRRQVGKGTRQDAASAVAQAEPRSVSQSSGSRVITNSRTAAASCAWTP